MARKAKHRETLDDLLASCSDTLFPEAMGDAPVTLESRDVDGDTPLHVMVWRNNSYAVQRFIEAGANVNAVGDMSETPLHVAVREGNVAVVEALLGAGADVSCTSEFGQTPRDLADMAGGSMRRLFDRR